MGNAMPSKTDTVRLSLAIGACLVLLACRPSGESTENADAGEAAARGAASVDGERLVNADSEPGQWMSHGRTYGEQRFSPLESINTSNVGGLGLAWYADMDTNRGQEATPLMVDGVIYVSTAWSKVKEIGRAHV